MNAPLPAQWTPSPGYQEEKLAAHRLGKDFVKAILTHPFEELPNLEPTDASHAGDDSTTKQANGSSRNANDVGAAEESSLESFSARPQKSPTVLHARGQQVLRHWPGIVLLAEVAAQ